MKLHHGRVIHPGDISFAYTHYWYQDVDDTEPRLIAYQTPQRRTQPILSMWGISTTRFFLGFMRCGKVREQP